MQAEGRRPATRRQLFRWLGWFAVANALVLGAAGLLYLHRFSFPDSAIALAYLISVYIGHHLVLAALPLMLVTGPVIVLKPSRRLATSLAVLVMALVIAVYVLDGLLWSQSRFHINALTVQILGWQSWVFVVVIALIGLLFESLLSQRVWAWVEKPARRHGGWLGAAGVVCLLLAWLIYAWSDANYYVPVTSLAERLPVYKGFTAKRKLEKLGLVDLERARERQLARRVSGDLADESSRLMNYPLNPLQCRKQNPRNLLIILLDAWRFDMLDERRSPRITAFGRRRGQVFHNHFSGGNGSRTGAFSFFYGLPPGYWSSIEAVQQPALLIEELQRQGYAMGIFSSGALVAPVELDRSAFSGIRDLHVSEPAGAPAWQRDAMMTDGWLAWLDDHDASRPFFGFLFYDATNSNLPPDDYPHRFEGSAKGPLALKFAGYQAVTHYVDALVGRVLDDLDRRGLLDDTVVVISADHGEEFDESHQGFDEHGSGFTRYQLQVPLITAWPGREAAEYRHRTSHYDIAPTLLEGVLGCRNPPADFSAGRNLFDGESWSWLIVASYFNYAVLEPDQLTITFPSGAYEIRDRDYQLLPDATVRPEILREVMSANTRFYAP